MLTTSQAAQIAGVAPSTVKRWADDGLLPSMRTAGGHRRFARSAVERMLRPGVEHPPEDPLVSAWIRCLIGGERYEIESRLLAARARLGAWHRVADEVGLVLVEMGRLWECDRLTIAEEHVASEALGRALARIGEAIRVPADGPACLLACAAGDDHTLGLALVELCVREVGRATFWLGRDAPVSEVVRLAADRRVATVALSASTASSDGRALSDAAARVGGACAKRGIALVLGGSGAWPDPPPHGVRLTSFGAFHAYLA